jgi:predicted nucleic acid-binding protein
MAVVVSDTTPLHYLILIGRDSVLRTLYGEIIVPPGVLDELGHPAAPQAILVWAKSPPAWLTVRAPRLIPQRFDNLDFGKRQALALAKEIHAELVLIDDKVARRCAERESLKVKGTLGVVADAAQAGLLNFRETVRIIESYEYAHRSETCKTNHRGTWKKFAEAFGRCVGITIARRTLEILFGKAAIRHFWDRPRTMMIG